jgi:hypothetical protein
MTRTRSAALAFGVALVTIATAARAHVVFDRGTLRQWTADSAAAAVVVFESDGQLWRADDGSDRQDFFRVRVETVLYGALAKGPLEFFPHAEGFPSFRAGERALLFLERTADRIEFTSLAPRFPWFSTQGAGQEWKIPPGEAGVRILEVAQRLASHRTQRPADPGRALREVLLAELGSGVARLRRDAIAELITARSRPGFLDAESMRSFGAFADAGELSVTERLALVRVLDGASGFDAAARLRAMTREPIEGPALTQLVRVAGASDDAVLRAWVATLASDARPEVQREARAALQRPSGTTAR